MGSCASCGHSNLKDSRFCSQCGNQIDVTQPKTRKSFIRRHYKRVIFISLMAAMVIVPVFVSFVVCKPEQNIFTEVQCQAQDNLGIYIGALIGLLTAIVFFWMEEQQKNTQEEFGKLALNYAKTYVIRSCMLNVKDMLSAKPNRIEKHDENRTYYLRILHEEFIQIYPHLKGLHNEIYDLLKSHNEIHESHVPDDPKICDICPDRLELISNPKSYYIPKIKQGLFSKIEECVKQNPQPFPPPREPKKVIPSAHVGLLTVHKREHAKLEDFCRLCIVRAFERMDSNTHDEEARAFLKKHHPEIPSSVELTRSELGGLSDEDKKKYGWLWRDYKPLFDPDI